MKKSYYIPEIAFELLVRSQCTRPLLLPFDPTVENQSEETIMYALGQLSEIGALEVDEQSESFSVSDEFVPKLYNMIKGETVVQYRGVYDDDTHFAYVSDKGVTYVDVPPNRLNVFKVDVGSTARAAKGILERLTDGNLDFSLPLELLSEMDALSEADGALLLDLSGEFEDCFALSGMLALMDFRAPEDGATKARIGVCCCDGVMKIKGAIKGELTDEDYTNELFEKLICDAAEV